MWEAWAAIVGTGLGASKASSGGGRRDRLRRREVADSFGASPKVPRGMRQRQEVDARFGASTAALREVAGGERGGRCPSVVPLP